MPQRQFGGQMPGQMMGQMSGQMQGQMMGQIPGQMPGQMPGQYAGKMVMGSENTEKPVDFLNWLGSFGLLFGSLFIPFIGWMVFLALLFIWSFKKSTPISKKNWARVSLIFTAIVFVLLIIFTISLMSSSMFQDMMKGTFDFNSYYEGLSGGIN